MIDHETQFYQLEMKEPFNQVWFISVNASGSVHWRSSFYDSSTKPPNEVEELILTIIKEGSLGIDEHFGQHKPNLRWTLLRNF